MQRLARVLVLVLPSSAYAAEYNVQFSPPNTTITWELGSALHTVHGTFQLKKGDVWFDPETGAMRGELTVAAASGESGNSLRDKKMRNSVLEADQFPSIVFRPSRAEGRIQLQGTSQLQLRGVFSIHGKEHEWVVPAKTVISNGAIAAILDFTIPYVEWGMKDPGTLMLRVDKTVKLQIKADGHLGKGL